MKNLFGFGATSKLDQRAESQIGLWRGFASEFVNGDYTTDWSEIACGIRTVVLAFASTVRQLVKPFHRVPEVLKVRHSRGSGNPDFFGGKTGSCGQSGLDSGSRCTWPE